MSRSLTAEEERLWRTLTQVKTRPGGRLRPEEELLWRAAVGGLHVPATKPAAVVAKAQPVPPPAPKPRPKTAGPLQGIEPKRARLIARQELEARIDLHGLDQDRAKAALIGFVERAFADGRRAVLVITGKGRQGSGVLRERTPEWLADQRIRSMVAGVLPAHPRHGGEGAIYVALKRRG